MNTLYYGDNLYILRNHDYFPTASVDLVYLDPPFNSSRNYNVLFKDESGQASEARVENIKARAGGDMSECGDAPRMQERGDHDVAAGATLGRRAFVVGSECPEHAFGLTALDELQCCAPTEAWLRKPQELAPTFGCVDQLSELYDLSKQAEALGDSGAAWGTATLLHALDRASAHVEQPAHPFVGQTETLADRMRIDGGGRAQHVDAS